MGKFKAPITKDLTTERDNVAAHLAPADLSRVQERARKWFALHHSPKQVGNEEWPHAAHPTVRSTAGTLKQSNIIPEWPATILALRAALQ